MVYLVLFVVLLLFSAWALIGLLVGGLWRKAGRARQCKGRALMLPAGMLLMAGVVALSQLTAHTPPIVDDQGRPVAGSIARLEQVTLNGRTQWISLRGHDRGAPVLLFLAGGPGGSQMAALRHELGELEKHFVVVNWDQPGAGKSYAAADIASLTPQTYIDDGLALTNLLREQLGQDKIYLMGESWGSALGLMLVHAQPQLYKAFIGTGQMVAFLETEAIDYQLALDMAAQNDQALVRRLKDNGPPPYLGADVTWKSAAYLNYLGAQMAKDPAITNGGYNTVRDLMAPEYGLLDKCNYIRGIIHTFNQVYPQLYPVDLRQTCPRVQVPVHFFLGRRDLNAPPALAQDYFDKLSAPEKQLIYFEHSGHSPWINESALFAQRALEAYGLGG